jgi:hypothetical protein
VLLIWLKGESLFLLSHKGFYGILFYFFAFGIGLDIMSYLIEPSHHDA